MNKIPRFLLVSHNLCPYVQRSVIVLEKKQIPFERKYIDLSNKPEWFLKFSPLGRVPALLVNTDEVVFESMVIVEYLDEITPGSLHPQNPLEKAQHRSWSEFGSSILNDIGGFYNAKEEESFAAKKSTIQEKFERLEKIVDPEGPFFSGREFSIVDAVYGPIFRYFEVFETFHDFGFFENTPKVRSWRKNLMAQDVIKKAAHPDYHPLLRDFIKRRKSILTEYLQ